MFNFFLKGFIFLLFIPSVLFSQNSTLTGHITIADSTELPGVTVVLKGTTYGTITDKEGNFRIDNLETGKYTLTASMIGFETAMEEITITAGNNRIALNLKESVFNLNEVVVTGTKTEKQLKDVPVITQVIIAEKMLEMGVTSLAEALPKIVPGLDLSQLGTKTTITMQGLSANYVLFLVDGERIAGEMNGDIDYSMLNLDNIERIEIIKGASSSLYGSNAIGGVINIITKKITKPFDAGVFSRYSGYNELFTSAGIALKKGVLGSMTNFNYSRTDGYDLTPESTHEWTQNPFGSLNISQKFEIIPNARFSMTPYFSYYRFERGNVSARPAHDLYKDLKYGCRGHYYWGKHSVSLSYYRDRYNTYNVLEKLNDQLDTISYDILQTLRTQANFNLSEKNDLTIGLEYNDENLFSERMNGNTRNSNEAVIYAQDDLRFGERWNLIVGIRASNQSSYGTHAAPKISLMYKQGFLNFRTSAGLGFRSPTLKELYMDFDHFGQWKLLGNPSLKPEESKYLSASVEFVKPWNNSSLTVYRNLLSDMINGDYWLPDSTQELSRQYQNIASAYINGFDLILKQKIIKGLLLSSAYSYVDSHDKGTKLQLYGTTKHSGNISLDYTFKKQDYSFTAQVFCKLSGEKFYDTATSIDKPYANWRLTITQEYKWLRFTAGVDNVFNKILPCNYNFISPGRRFFGSISIDVGKMR